ncbi:AfsR/SARP family transcriptional regulator [Streptomyces alkaliterrae]|uniref:AfsR/SARP family transcriptional regulator n=1 Tax=Streptomyces alkaliterrae TaxID=2213162 RepID=A0A5P0YQH0_9ACTN|nr:AfsR/SARP family transcriptional regulator [Streptomyces alkaliterrae]MBB1254954.1 AfsR/SARP family transcriptional regulator [Streptomyces alkaliterrae]MBB1261274.1 AfsR/SARP family transcriptional regulator [Streptomyces alkaliterrae]MQS02551.1 hypothetical protein [Streptomyces alkaliterrae]
MLNFEILGGLQVHSPTGVHEVSGVSKRVLLQALLVSEERTVSHGALVEEVWGEDVPTGVVNALQAHISRLRKWLRSIGGDAGGTRLVSFSHGYQLVLGDARLDATDFRDAVVEAAALRESEPEKAVDALRSALPLWRGPVFGGNFGGLLSECAATRYNELRLQALETLFDAEISLGRHASLLGELYEAHRANPLRERFCAQLMLALYRSGRQAEALTVYRRTRDRLGDELGIDPTPDLRKLEECILRHAPWLRSAADNTPALAPAGR